MLRSLLVCATALGLLTACGDDGGGDTGNVSMTSPTTTTPMTDGMTTDAMTTDDMTTDAMTTDAMTTDAMTTDAMTTDAMTTEATTAETMGGGDACEPEADDDKCSMCLKTMCCDELQACRDSADCDCILTCIDESGMGAKALGMCQMECRVEVAPPEVGGLAVCQAMMCQVCA
jgi:pentapeptide MXKDX repeat protein